MGLKIINRIVVLSFVLFALSTIKAKSNYSAYFKKLPFEMQVIKPPVFKNNIVTILQTGGKGDGITLNTIAFEKAIQQLTTKGGGKLLVPAGVWLTGPIILKSNINLHLEKGALILFSPDLNLYPLVNTSFEGLDTKRCQSPISGINLNNIAITGHGTINGSGEVWRPLKKSKVTESYWKKVVQSGGVLKTPDYWFPSASSLKGESASDMNVPKGSLLETQWLEIKDFLRPVMISLTSCKNVLLQDVLFENSPSWNIHPLMCENLIVDNIMVRNPSFAQNGDGIDIESCKNTLVINSVFDVGDDAICVKSGKDKNGRARNIPTENLIVDNCKVFRGHGGFVVGSEMSGGVKNIVVRNCQFLGTDVGLRFKSKRGRGGIVENIYISNIYMYDIITDSFLFDLFYGGKSASESMEDGDVNVESAKFEKVTEETPIIRNIFFKDIVSRNANRAMYFNGLPEMNISNINIENAILSAKTGAVISESNGIDFKNIQIYANQGSPLTLINVKNFTLKNFETNDSDNQKIKIEGKCENIHLPEQFVITESIKLP